MKRQDAFLIHHRNLYNYKVHHEPTMADFSFLQATNQNSDTDSGIEKVSFVVEWQLQVNDMNEFNENSTHDTRAEYTNPNVGTEEPCPDSATNEPAASSHVSGRKVNYWVF